MKGHLGYEKWYVFHEGIGHVYQASRIIDGENEVRRVTAHCLQCAKVETVAKYGGEVDRRGGTNDCSYMMRGMLAAMKIGEEPSR